ncbi:MAG: DUF2520 domain-containing protein [Solirubrobacteraceae bacterium]
MDIPTTFRRIAIVGDGRAGNALAGALGDAPEISVEGPLGRGAAADRADAVLLCVPDGEIAAAARAIPPGPLVGHVSGASGTETLAPHEGFSLHPLMTLLGAGASLHGAWAAVAGSTPRALRAARELALAAGMQPFELAEEDRPAYHAAASIASNFLLVVEQAAERLARSAGVGRSALVPLVRASVENWAAVGAEQALTGPIARGDEATVELQRAAVAERAPDLLALFDELRACTEVLVHGDTEFAGASPR